MTLRTLLRVGLGFGLLAVVLARADLGDARRSLLRAHVPWLIVALLAQVGAKTLWAYRWSALLRAAGYVRRTLELLGIVLVGLFFGSFLPSSVGGDVARGIALAARGVPKAVAAASVLADRIVGVVSLAVAAACGGLLASRAETGRVTWLAEAAAAAVFGGAALLAMRPTLLRHVAQRLPKSISFRATRVVDSFALVARKRGLLLVALVLSVGLVALSSVFCWSLARAIDIDVSFAAWLVIVPAVMLLSAIPLTPNGMGIREAGFVGFLATHGVPSSQGALFAVLALILPLPFSVAGGVIFAAGDGRAVAGRPQEGGTS
jgi:hypothetical protein